MLISLPSFWQLEDKETAHFFLWCRWLSTKVSKILGQGSSPWGKTNLNSMINRDKVIQEFKILLRENMRNTNMIVRTAEELNVTNEQFYLDWEDFINAMSVKDHSI